MRNSAWLALAVLFVTSATSFEYPATESAARWFLAAIGWISAACVCFGVVYTLAATWLVRRFFSRPIAWALTFPAVTVIKPLHGGERDLLQNLVSFCGQDYPGPVQFVFGVHDSLDSALDVVERLKQQFPDADISVVADPRLYGPNRKMSNILNMLPAARHDIFVFADSDVMVEPDYLRQVVGELHQPDVGLVTCLYTGQPDSTFWSRLSASATNYQFLPGVILGLSIGMARPCFGQTLAMRRGTLDAIGGFSQFVHHLAEDHAIGEAVRLLGQKVVVPAFTVGHACVENSAARFFAHELRWSRTIRTIDPAGHAGSIMTYPLAFALLFVTVSGGTALSWVLTGVAIVVRLLLMLQLDRVFRRRSGMALLPLWDLILFAVFVMSFASSRVVWRGFTFKVDREGRLIPVVEEFVDEHDATGLP